MPGNGGALAMASAGAGLLNPAVRSGQGGATWTQPTRRHQTDGGDFLQQPQAAVVPMCRAPPCMKHWRVVAATLFKRPLSVRSTMAEHASLHAFSDQVGVAPVAPV